MKYYGSQTNNDDIVTKKYVDDTIASDLDDYVAKSGSTMTGALKVTAPMVASATADGSITIEHGTASNDAMLITRRTDTGTSMGVGVGTGGTNHGIYSHTLGKWMIYGTSSAVMVNGNAENITGIATVPHGGTGLSTLTSGAALIGNGTGNVTTRSITNNTTATAAASSSTNLITQNTLYYATASINNARQTSAVNIYAPTSAGTANQILVSSGGTSAPTWKATASGAAYATSANGTLTFGLLPVAQGGTGASTFTSGAALIGAGTGAITTRAITNNTAAASAITANTNLITQNTLRYALNRTTGPTAADTNYTTYMMRAMAASTADLTAGSSSLTSGAVYLVYEA